MLTFTVITIFPQMFASTLGHSILKRAQEKKLLKINLVDLRDYTTDKHKTTDDSPYGGGQGMVMKPEPLVAAIEDARTRNPKARVILLAPQGRVFKQSVAQRMAGEDEIVLLCGRYEGIDERVKGVYRRRDFRRRLHAQRRRTGGQHRHRHCHPIGARRPRQRQFGGRRNPSATAYSSTRNTPVRKIFAA